MAETGTEVVLLDDKLNQQIADGRFVALIGLDADNNAAVLIPSGTAYEKVTLPGLTDLSGYAAAASSCYCNCSTRTVWCCFGTVCWNTGKPCSC